jgi:tetratricopeptide (TPR) repeat protein
MNKNLFLCLCSFLLGSVSGFATAFEDANQQFKSGDFAGAAAAYEKILKSEGPRASVYYNLGNSYQQLKQYGPTILAYERARLLTPRDPDLLANLTLARKAATAFEETGLHPWLDAVVNRLSRNEWSWLVAGSALFLGMLAVVAGAVKLPRRGILVSAGAAGVLMAAASAALYLRRGETVRGIVLSESATVRLSPFEKAESLGTPGPGRIVRLGTKNGDFQYIEVPGAGLKGWLASKDVAAIVR